MTISYPDILEYRTQGVEAAWSDQDAILYALGAGMGDDPLNERELPFVYEAELKTLPTFATIIARRADPGPLPLNKALVLDGGRDLTLHRPMPATARVVMEGRIVSVADKGADKGAIITREVVIRDASDGQKIATLVTDVFARGDGGFGGPSPSKISPPGRPSGDPHRTVEIATRPGQALLYRLSGDRNPLHADPATATRAGFPRPILHGLCTYAIACRAVLQTYADYDPAAIRRFAARFSAPTFPGETVCVDLWQTDGVVAFEARIRDRDAVVLRSGRAVLG